MTRSVTIIPAQPGFFIVNRVTRADDTLEAVLDPIIAWQVNVGEVGTWVVPVTLEVGDVDEVTAVVARPGGSVVHNDTTYSSVADWLQNGSAA